MEISKSSWHFRFIKLAYETAYDNLKYDQEKQNSCYYLRSLGFAFVRFIAVMCLALLGAGIFIAMPVIEIGNLLQLWSIGDKAFRDTCGTVLIIEISMMLLFLYLFCAYKVKSDQWRIPFQVRQTPDGSLTKLIHAKLDRICVPLEIKE